MQKHQSSDISSKYSVSVFLLAGKMNLFKVKSDTETGNERLNGPVVHKQQLK